MTDALAVPASARPARPLRARRALRAGVLAVCAAGMLAGGAETVNDRGVTKRQGAGAAIGAG
ncbi:MAG: hypothetical protein VX463_18795, partial [Pseudomonadota bacterium]|nr:hypothetical protein [Pseudomonadota bacterium]